MSTRSKNSSKNMTRTDESPSWSSSYTSMICRTEIAIAGRRDEEATRNGVLHDDISRLDKLQEIELIACRGIPSQMSNLWSLSSFTFSRMCRDVNAIDFPPVQFRSLTCLVLDGARNDVIVPSAMCSWIEQSYFPVFDTLNLKHVDRVDGLDRTASRSWQLAGALQVPFPQDALAPSCWRLSR